MKRFVLYPGILLLTTLLTASLLLSRNGFTKSGKTFAASDSAAPANNTLLRAQQVYQQAGLAAAGLDQEVFLQAWKGYQKLEQQGKLRKPLLTIADMGKPSGQKRLYIIDVAQQRLLRHTWVSHGRNSGDVMAHQFSNNPSSLQSSLGFFLTSDTYQGSNGYSMRLHGLEKGINDKALSRAIVMHGAPYVNEQLARTGRIGRSWGCPAVSMPEHKEIINTIKGGSCLFIYAPQQQYLARSAYLANDSLL
ncbi:MAG: murein L,D-transpeptidase catalytic domain family protein [Chitinophagaceae bacterium]|jgi:hypothetical protein|nr:murein L,D-transpeptidase catalytic domain family protein [Chitinophagaceae bacterium]